jgi:hypothetical protein
MVSVATVWLAGPVYLSCVFMAEAGTVFIPVGDVWNSKSRAESGGAGTENKGRQYFEGMYRKQEKEILEGEGYKSNEE